MEFCQSCENLLILQGTTLRCNNCGNTTPFNLKEKSCIIENNYNSVLNILPENLKYVCSDPTLPHINFDNINCPNKKCKSNDNLELKNIVYLKISDKDMKYKYICSICYTAWTNQ